MVKNVASRGHALCFPFALQSHMKAMLKVSKLLHNKGFFITFVNTEFNHERFLRSTGLDAAPLPALGFRFETIPDGLPPSNPDATQDIPSLCHSTRTNFAGPFLDLVNRINRRAAAAEDDDDVAFPPVSCLVVDGFMSLAVGSTAEVLGIPLVKFFPISTNGVVGYQQYGPILERGLVPIKDETSMETLENTVIDWVPGMKGLRMKDLPFVWQITDVNDIMFNFCKDSIATAFNCDAVVLQTYNELESDILESLAERVPHLYTVGPLELLLKCLPNDPLSIIPYSLWKEETDCLKWLDGQKSGSVIYVNFGSIAVLTPEQILDIGYGLANSGHSFLWMIRPDLVIGESARLSPEFLAKIKDRSLITSWCPQEEVLRHLSIGGFLTHCGWNSIVESLTCGVPMLCFPFFAEQQTNCWLVCEGLKVGLEIDKAVKRDQIEGLVRNLMAGEKGKRMRKKALELKKAAEAATKSGGSSVRNFEDLVNNVLLKEEVVGL